LGSHLGLLRQCILASEALGLRLAARWLVGPVKLVQCYA